MHVVYDMVGLVYLYTKLILYNTLVITLGIPFAILGALLNGMMAFFLVWFWGPLLRLLLLLMYSMAPVVTVPLIILFSPMGDAYARVYRKIQIKADINGNVAKKLLDCPEEQTA